MVSAILSPAFHLCAMIAALWAAQIGGRAISAIAKISSVRLVRFAGAAIALCSYGSRIG
jgi:hypothetical protein